MVILENHQLPALLQNVPPASVWNKDRRRGRKRFYLTSTYIPQTLEDAILDLYRC